MNKFTLAQQKAIDARHHNYVVSAGAGSGKTTVLTERVLKLLKSGVSIRNMLILTFTNNAAKNMKERIKKVMSQEESLSSQIKYVDSADISTFDSFNQKIVRKYRNYLGISEDFLVADGTYMMTIKKRVLNEIFQSHYESGDSIFLDLLSKYTERNDEAIKSLILKTDDELSKAVDYDKTLEEVLLKTTTREFYVESYENVCSLILEQVKEVEKIIAGIDTVSKKAGEIKEDYRSLVLSLEELVSKKDFEKYGELLESHKFLVMRSIEIYEKEELGFAKEEIKKLSKYGNISPLDQYLESSLASNIYKEKIASLTKEFHKAIDEYKTRNSYYEFNDIALLALKLMTDYPPVLKEIKETYEEIMVDEYQDNSDLQEAVIDLLERDNLFLVGDVKQSIYRFRKANPTLFMSRYDKYKKDLGGIAIDMNENFRSTPVVINSINDIFSKIMTTSFGGAQYAESHTIISSNKNYEKIEKMENIHYVYERETGDKKSEVEARAIATDIVSKIESGETINGKPVSYSDFAILLDRGTNFDDYIKVFGEYGIPLFVDQDQNARDTEILSTLKNLVKLYDCLRKSDEESQSFRRSLLATARSFSGLDSDKDIHLALTKGDYSKLNTYLKMKECLSVDSDDLYKAILNIIDKFEVVSKLSTLYSPKDNIAILEIYIDTIKSLSNLGLSPSDIVEYFDSIKRDDLRIQLKINSSTTDAVTLTNIHKSKGLEYNICYYSGLTSPYNELDITSSFKYSNDYGIILPDVSSENYDNPLDELCKRQMLKEDRSEKIRLLYVALTRAKYYFILVGPKAKDKFKSLENSDSLWGLLLNSGYLNMVKEQEYEESENKSQVSFDFSHDFKDYGFSYHELPLIETSTSLKKRASKVATHANEETLKFGEYVHAICESIDFANPNYDGIDKYMIKHIKHMVEIINSLGASEASVYHEYQYYDEVNESLGIIDLLLLFEDRAIIVDYKLKNISDLEYVEQLKTYARVVEDNFKVNVTCYLYSIIDEILQAVEMEGEKV